MLKSPHNKLYSETMHNYPLIIKTTCIVSYDKYDKNKIIGLTLVQSASDGGSKRISLPLGYKLPW